MMKEVLGHRIRVFLASLGGALVACCPGLADICMIDMWDNNTEPPGLVFPNWTLVRVGSFDVTLCMTADGCNWVGNEYILSLTVVNFGSAVPADFKGVYWRASCGGTGTGVLTLTYAGMYSVDTGVFPAWTWTGMTPDFSGCPDLCGTPACGGFFTIDIYLDIAGCPAEGSTVEMGFPCTGDMFGWASYGSIIDNADCPLPLYDTVGPKKKITYVTKEGPEVAAPGDTINYTIVYGRPGTGTIGTIWITDSMPPYTHYVWGSGIPAPDPGWDPNPGPPMKLLWTIPGPFPVGGGPTGKVTFSVTVDWGNGESFEPGSGNAAAPEGSFLFNRAHFAWSGSGCSPGRLSLLPVTVVRRYLFWMIGDNDVLFAPRVGLPDDEIIYDIFVKSMSKTKTWWDVRIWDTVPDELDVWTPGYGFEDPCWGWTMTPTGCAAASPGTVLSGTNTLLTWKLDMPPDMTIALRWKARVKPTASSGDTALNRMSIMEMGRSKIIEGTGHSQLPRYFTHQALIVLRTSYVSYVGYAATENINDFFFGCLAPDPMFWVSFYPLNKAADFALYKKWCCPAAPCDASCAGFAASGGVSPTINVYAGGCTSGGADWEAGCKAERAPARYTPQNFMGVAPAVPFNLLYKMTANAPFLWEILSGASEHHGVGTYEGTTSLTFCGYIGYSDLRNSCRDAVEDFPTVFNTSPAASTMVLIFEWDSTALSWTFKTIRDLYNESLWTYYPPLTGRLHTKIISSETNIMIRKGVQSWHATESGVLVPNKETGNTVSTGTPSTFYMVAGPGSTGWAGAPKSEGVEAIFGNVGGVDANYKVWKYVPLNPALVPPAGVDDNLTGNAGDWIALGIDTVPAGLANSGNAHIYGPDYDTKWFPPAAPARRVAAYKAEVLSGGPIQIVAGSNPYEASANGSIVHPSVPAGQQVGTEFWLHTCSCTLGNAAYGCGLANVDVFCPKAGMAVRAVSSGGYTATYTTTGPDQCVAFFKVSLPATGLKMNWKFNVLTSGNALTMFNDLWPAQKNLTAPFVVQGTFYTIIAPPVVFVGQSFWVTVVVTDTGGGTKTDYTGTTSFTSSDPKAQFAGVPMDSYNYLWTLGDAGVKVFVNVSLSRLGMVSIVASDTMDGSIVGLTTIMVVAADIKLEKRKRLSVAASGDTVQFNICWSNFSAATGFSFTITDAVPMGTTYVPELANTMLCGSSAPVPGITVWYSTATTTTPPGTFTSVPGTGSPLGNTRWLRWTIRDVYVNSTGCVCFKVSVN